MLRETTCTSRTRGICLGTLHSTPGHRFQRVCVVQMPCYPRQSNKYGGECAFVSLQLFSVPVYYTHFICSINKQTSTACTLACAMYARQVRPRTAAQPLTSKISTSVYVLKLRGKNINLNEISTLGGRDREQT